MPMAVLHPFLSPFRAVGGFDHHHFLPEVVHLSPCSLPAVPAGWSLSEGAPRGPVYSNTTGRIEELFMQREDRQRISE